MTTPKVESTAQPTKPPQYEAPQLIRWGTLRDLTEGGGGTKNEPGTGRRTRL